MVFIGGWRPGRRNYGGYGPGPYGAGGYGRMPRYGRGFGGGGSSCGRDLCLVESGCCLADLLGCGPGFALLGPSVLHRSVRAATAATREGAEAGLRQWTLRFLYAAIGFYKSEISPRRRPCCRYNPTCSQYALDALHAHGLRRGVWLTARRLLRCRPGAVGGFDPVPASPR